MTEYCPIRDCQHAWRRHYIKLDGTVHCTAGSNVYRCKCTLTSKDYLKVIYQDCGDIPRKILTVQLKARA